MNMTIRARTGVALLTLSSALALCPALAEAGAWTLPSGTNWLKVGFMFQDTTERYFLEGERIPYFFEGRNRTTALFLEYVRGITDRWEIKAQLPFFGISFDDIADDRTSNGLGDLRVESKYQLVDAPLVVAVGGTVKFPTGEFVNDAEIVPVGEGQLDLDLFAEVGRSLWPVRGYVTGKLGYRFRTPNETTDIDFGDEIIWRAEVGYQLTEQLSAKLLFRGLYGFESTSFDIPIQTLKREVVYIEPGMSFAVTERSAIELSVPISVRGRNWPAGPVWNLSFTQTF